MKILVLNCGSSSVKFQLAETDAELIEQNKDRVLAEGTLERIGGEALLTFETMNDGEEKRTSRSAEPVRDHAAAVDKILKWLISKEAGIKGLTSLAGVEAVGHRVVHGGEAFSSSVKIDAGVIKQIELCIELAPLHNPQNLKGIFAVQKTLGEAVPQVAVFDTAFHHTLPEHAYLYAIPYQLYRRHKIRRYGFHGISHRYVGFRYRTIAGKEKDEVTIISAHLGNGCSLCAIKRGDSIDTSMGLTPLEGLVMGTRSGDLDPAVVEYIAHKEGLTLGEIQTLLNKESGLLGVSGLTNDMRELLDEVRDTHDRRATLAVQMFCYRLKKYIGSYLAAMNGAAAIVFTGGIGENAASVREKVLNEMQWCGIELDKAANEKAVKGAEARITTEASRIAVWVIPTNEELLIARDTFRAVMNLPQK
ncbi:MAG: acetate kinase [Rhizobacter sp.]|nr:acetate kinase [Chlorobiales bacterium]